MNTLTKSSKPQVQYIAEIVRFMSGTRHSFLNLTINAIDINVIEGGIIPMFGLNVLVQIKTVPWDEPNSNKFNSTETTLRDGAIGDSNILVINPTHTKINDIYKLGAMVNNFDITGHREFNPDSKIIVLNINEVLI